MSGIRFIAVVFCTLFLLPVAGRAGIAAAKGPFRLQTSVIGAAGCPGAAAGIATNGTLGQSTPIGIGSRADRVLYAGFWFGRRSVLADTPVPPPLVDALYQNHPNPFNPATTICFDLAERSPVSLKIYDLSGRCVATLVRDSLPAGPHSVVWRGRDDGGRRTASGLYFYRLDTDDYRSVKKMLLLK